MNETEECISNATTNGLDNVHRGLVTGKAYMYYNQSLKKPKTYLPTSDNFSFQNNGIKKCTCWKTMGFLGKKWVFGVNNVCFCVLKQCF